MVGRSEEGRNDCSGMWTGDGEGTLVRVASRQKHAIVNFDVVELLWSFVYQ